MSNITPRKLTLAQRTKYKHELDMLESNPQTHKIQTSLLQQVKDHKFRSRTTLKNKQEDHYNKWYIDASLRYQKKSQDPKKNRQTLRNQQYVYQNLHNDNFWNWMHPLQGRRIKSSQKKDISEKVDRNILQKFKNYMVENKSNSRLPLVVKSVLSNNI